ncbi:hypothetical protein [Motiliproteus sp. MSK22-1]|uniref:hypothetical protein n=1 Tax=Motiliproteus sp. MSK22-1 TaxID=1897630 RepID=UPI000977BE6D|nr:hypothetical protein [Motiliproteus sp. MSK22-1]OMH31794.1 hypothetical protein BGP75_16910 [Motiliproteus sp. MSK22-1]
MKRLQFLLLIAVLSSPSFATEYRSDYSGQQNREIKSLSIDDIQQIQAGKGWGLAKAAELNGYPGPRHVLDMAEELGLTSDQQETVKTLFELMQTQAVVVGERYLKIERQIDLAFNNKNIDSNSLKKLIDNSAEALAELRYVHLEKHLAVIRQLSQHQVVTYNKLRGYDSGDAQHKQH